MKFGKLFISGSLLAWLAWTTDWSQVQSSFARLRIEWWLAAFALFLLTQLVAGQRWRLLARPLGFGQTHRQFTAFVFIGLFTNLMLPTAVGGDVVKAWYLAGGTRRKLASLLTVFTDRVSGLVVLLALACCAALLSPLPLPARVHWTVWGAAGAFGLGLILMPVVSRFSQRFDRLDKLMEAARIYLRQPRLLLAATGLALVVQAANVVVVWLIGRALDAPVPAAYYWILVPMVSLLVMAPVSVNGMGIREWSMTLFLAPLGIAPATALSLAWLWFAVTTCAGLVGGIVYLFAGQRPAKAGQSFSADFQPTQSNSDKQAA